MKIRVRFDRVWLREITGAFIGRLLAEL